MIEKRDFSENTAIIKSSSHTVRVMLGEAETVFSASDILNACGIKYPIRWFDRNRKAHPEELVAEKLGYPMMTEYGYRRIKMIFVSAEVAKKIIRKTACSPETKRWLMEEVITYRLNAVAVGVVQAATVAEGDVGEVQSERKPPEYDDSINRRIDSILIELLELKKIVAGAAALV